MPSPRAEGYVFDLACFVESCHLGLAVVLFWPWAKVWLTGVQLFWPWAKVSLSGSVALTGVQLFWP
jgi:hypothetical protein